MLQQGGLAILLLNYVTSCPPQNLPAGTPQMFVTLNPLHTPKPESVIRRLSLAHPVYSFEAVQVGGCRDFKEFLLVAIRVAVSKQCCLLQR